MPDRRPIPESDRARVGQARLAAFVIAGTMLLWMGGQWLGGQFGWEARFAFLFDLAALAGFSFALVVTYRIWRKQPKN